MTSLEMLQLVIATSHDGTNGDRQYDDEEEPDGDRRELGDRDGCDWNARALASAVASVGD